MSEIERCPTCGSSVRLEGTITRYFMPVENERIADLERQLAEKQAEIEAMRPVVERLYYAESYLEEAVTDADIQTGIKHATGLLEDIRGTLKEYESRKQP